MDLGVVACVGSEDGDDKRDGQLEAMAFLTRWRIGERNRTPRPVLCLGLGHGIVLGPCRRPRSLLPSLSPSVAAGVRSVGQHYSWALVRGPAGRRREPKIGRAHV